MHSIWDNFTNHSSTVHTKWFNKGNQTFTTVPNGNITEEHTLDEIFFTIASTVCVTGTFGNLAIICLFIFQKKLKIPTYTGIFCASVPDLFSLVLRYFSIFPDKFPWAMSFQYFYGLTAIANFSSNYHLLIIAIIRYIYISKPFYSLTFTYTKVVSMSVGVWICSLIVAVLYSVHLYLVSENLMSMSHSGIVELSTLCFSFFGSLIPIAILHIVNIINIRKGISKSVVSFQKTMSAILATIIIISFVTNTPALIVNILYLNQVNISIEILTSASILLMISCSSNPFVYFLFSKTAKKTISRFVTCKCLRI